MKKLFMITVVSGTICQPSLSMQEPPSSPAADSYMPQASRPALSVAVALQDASIFFRAPTHLSKPTRAEKKRLKAHLRGEVEEISTSPKELGRQKEAQRKNNQSRRTRAETT